MYHRLELGMESKVCEWDILLKFLLQDLPGIGGHLTVLDFDTDILSASKVDCTEEGCGCLVPFLHNLTVVWVGHCNWPLVNSADNSPGFLTHEVHLHVNLPDIPV